MINSDTSIEVSINGVGSLDATGQPHGFMMHSTIALVCKRLEMAFEHG